MDTKRNSHDGTNSGMKTNNLDNRLRSDASITETTPILGDVEVYISSSGGEAQGNDEERHDASYTKDSSSIPKHDSHRMSILTDDALAELEAIAGEEAVNTLTKTPLGLGVQVLIFCWLTLVIGLSPFIMQLALYDPVLGKKAAHFLPQGPYVAEFFIVLVIANILSFLFYGKEGFKQCWNFKHILKLSPISLLHGASEAVELGALVYLDGSLRSIINQLKLPVVGFLRRVFMKEKRTIQQWLLIACITISVWGFILSDIKSQVSVQRVEEIVGPGLTLGLIAVGTSIGAGFSADILTKKLNQRYIIQMAQLRLTTMIVILVAMVGYAYWVDQLWKIPFYGWNIKVVGLVLWLVLKDFTTIYVLKRLDSFWPALASSSGLVVTFATDLIYFQEPFRPMSFVFICLVSLLIIALSLGKKKH